MRRAQVVVYESDGRLADLLREPAARQAWWLREVRTPAGALEALQPGGAGVFVLKVGRDLVREMELLEQASWQYPDVPSVVVGDAANAPLEQLAWDLGAGMVLFPPLPRTYLPEVVAGLLAGREEGPPAAADG